MNVGIALTIENMTSNRALLCSTQGLGFIQSQSITADMTPMGGLSRVL